MSYWKQLQVCGIGIERSGLAIPRPEWTRLITSKEPEIIRLHNLETDNLPMTDGSLRELLSLGVV